MNKGLIFGLIAVGLIFAVGSSSAKTPAQKRQELITYLSNTGEISVIDIVRRDMTDDEIETLYTFTFKYWIPGGGESNTNLVIPEALKTKMAALSSKYNIFT